MLLHPEFANARVHPAGASSVHLTRRLLKCCVLFCFAEAPRLVSIGFIWQVDNFNRPHPQLDIPPSDAKYTLQSCFSRADQLDQHQNPWQGRMGLKELDFRELDERRAWAADQPMPTLQELAAMPDEFDARKRWPQCGWLNSPKDQLECGRCLAARGRMPRTAPSTS